VLSVPCFRLDHECFFWFRDVSTYSGSPSGNSAAQNRQIVAIPPDYIPVSFRALHLFALPKHSGASLSASLRLGGIPRESSPVDSQQSNGLDESKECRTLPGGETVVIAVICRKKEILLELQPLPIVSRLGIVLWHS